MNYLLIADAYEPATISAAQQLHDLVTCLAAEDNIQISVLIPDVSGGLSVAEESQGNITIIRAKCLKAKDVNYFRRTIAELLLPFSLYRAYQRSSIAKTQLHGIIWYSPTIFLGPIVAWLKRQHHCRSYLILRDLFPDWAVDAGVMKKGLAYRVLKWVESYQYQQADVIGVQTPANLPHLQAWASDHRRIEVLQNWLAPVVIKPCSINIANTSLVNRKIFVYSGNMGVAQDMWPVMQAVKQLQRHNHWGFLFVGRGSETDAMQCFITNEKLDNALLLNEISPEEIPGLFQQCDVGIVALDPRHTTHNVPGKFIAYTRSGLPILGRINAGNDLLTLINEGEMGFAVANSDVDAFVAAAEQLMSLSEVQLTEFKGNAHAQWLKHYSVESITKQLLNSLTS